MFEIRIRRDMERKTIFASSRYFAAHKHPLKFGEPSGLLDSPLAPIFELNDVTASSPTQVGISRCETCE